jgi:hypothetical protein
MSNEISEYQIKMKTIPLPVEMLERLCEMNLFWKANSIDCKWNSPELENAFAVKFDQFMADVVANYSVETSIRIMHEAVATFKFTLAVDMARLTMWQTVAEKCFPFIKEVS